MSKKSKTIWTPDNERELKKAVRNFNDKIRRLEKKDPKNKAALPKRASVKQLKQLISTKTDLNREINSLKRFSDRGAEKLVTAPKNKYNLKITKWQRDDMNRRKRAVNERRKRELKKISDVEIKHRGKKTGYKKGELGMGGYDENAFNPINAFTPAMTRADLDDKTRVLQRESQSNYWTKRHDLHKQNYIKSIEENLGSSSDVKEIVNTIEGMDYEQFRKIYESENALIEHSYPPDEEKKQEEIQFLKSVWLPHKITIKHRKKEDE